MELEEMENEIGKLNLELAALELSDADLRQAIRILGREAGRRGIANYTEKEHDVVED